MENYFLSKLRQISSSANINTFRHNDGKKAKIMKIFIHDIMVAERKRKTLSVGSRDNQPDSPRASEPSQQRCIVSRSAAVDLSHRWTLRLQFHILHVYLLWLS